MCKQIVLFEPEEYQNLFPLSLNRPVYDLRCGINTMAEKVAACYPDVEIAYHCRDYLAPLVQEKKSTSKVNQGFHQEILLINGLVLWNEHLANTITLPGPDGLFVCEGQVIAARVSNLNLACIPFSKPLAKHHFHHLPIYTVKATLIRHTWDLILENANELVYDYQRLQHKGTHEGNISKGAFLLEADHITIAKNATIKPGVVLDAEHGPIYIGEDTEVLPHSYIQGPCFIGKKCLIKSSSKIYHGTSIGESCKIGGEIEQSIFHSYSNKQHEGFIGHSYIGMWVNLGANTNNSDLKNDYGYVKCYEKNTLINTHQQFLGVIMGDHVKTGINTMFNTGSIVGICCNLFGSGFFPKMIQSFSWGGKEEMVEYRFEKCIQVAKRMMQRRNQILSDHELDVLYYTFLQESHTRNSNALEIPYLTKVQA